METWNDFCIKIFYAFKVHTYVRMFHLYDKTFLALGMWKHSKPTILIQKEKELLLQMHYTNSQIQYDILVIRKTQLAGIWKMEEVREGGVMYFLGLIKMRKTFALHWEKWERLLPWTRKMKKNSHLGLGKWKKTLAYQLYASVFLWAGYWQLLQSALLSHIKLLHNCKQAHPHKGIEHFGWNRTSNIA